jgi:hypothetical protein
MAKRLHGGPLEGGESAWVPSQRVYELDDCQPTSESRMAPILLRTDGQILMRQNQGRYSLLHLYIHSRTSRLRHQDCRRHLPGLAPAAPQLSLCQSPGEANFYEEKNP